MDPYTQHYSFQNLLNSQQPYTQNHFSQPLREPSIDTVSTSDASVFGPEGTEDGNEDAETVSNRKERRKWTPTEDGVLISAWLNTSKDPVVGNEQKANAFWQRIAAYFAASPKLAGLQKRDRTCCKQRWAKINEAVSRFVGCYVAATKQRSSGQNEDDVLKIAHQIFYNDYKVKFTMEHAWLELRHDQKWCGASTDKVQGKRRKLGDQGSQSATYGPGNHVEDEARPVGVKASKAKGKSSVSKQASLEEKEKERKEFQNVWELREKDFALKDKLNKQKLLDKLMVFEQPESNRSSEVDFTFSTDMPSNLGNMMANRNQIRDRKINQQLKADLVENIWQKFGANGDFN
ncbi:PREDICTED: glutathione S-transferase T3-like [Brassica oleracea var. oleracea]|uniref:glutathione S-transferase T3-like n=1 Tax=Brassica oleracea var. oleracea TaxID=109376 RepID=UPI0006A6F0EA|nr:PREDICTED: glutathione S-transferase T3-like [Brassica oleracea var. oleracea]